MGTVVSTLHKIRKAFEDSVPGMEGERRPEVGASAPPLPTTWSALLARSEASGQFPSSGRGGGGAGAGARLRWRESQHLPEPGHWEGRGLAFWSPGSPASPEGERGQPRRGMEAWPPAFFFFFVLLDKERFPCAFKS